MKTKVIRLSEKDMLPAGKVVKTKRPKQVYRHWTEEEDQYLRDNYHKTPVSEMVQVLNRKNGSVVRRAQNLGLRGYIPGKWSQEEEAYMLKWYGKKNITDIAKHLGRRYHQVTNKAQDLCLQQKRKYVKKEAK